MSASDAAASYAASMTPADLTCASHNTSATMVRKSATLLADCASSTQGRLKTGNGSSSPAIATSITTRKSCALVANSSSTIGTDTSAAAAIARIVVLA